MFRLRMFLMRKEQSDIEQLKKILQDNSSHEDLDSFFSATSADYATYVDKDKIGAYQINSNLSVTQRFFKFIKGKYDELDIGPKVKNPILNTFVESLYQNKSIKKSDLRILRRFILLAVDQDDLVKLIQPTSIHKRRALFGLVMLALALVIVGILVWNTDALQHGFKMLLFTFGALLGHYIRASYDSYWGRLRLYNLLRHNNQFIFPLMHV